MIRLHPVITAALVAVVAAGLTAAQRPDAAAVRTRLADARPLHASEIDELLVVVRQTGGGRPFRLLAEDGRFSVASLMERDGHVRYVHETRGGRTIFTE